jgi:hypothetical protein
MYHGTNQDFSVPRTTHNSGAFFVTPDPNFANRFAANDLAWFPTKRGIEPGSNVMPVYISAKNPFDYEVPQHLNKILPAFRKVLKDEEGYNKAQIDAAISGLRDGSFRYVELASSYNILQDAGFDAFYVNESGKNLGVYNPTQIKSATGNLGTYSATNPDIRYSLRPFDPKELPQNKKEYTLPANTVLYHGAHEARAKDIEKAGKTLISRSPIKTSGGATDEGGLVYFTSLIIKVLQLQPNLQLLHPSYKTLVVFLYQHQVALELVLPIEQLIRLEPSLHMVLVE